MANAGTPVDILDSNDHWGMGVRKQWNAIGVIAVGGVCAGLVWASQALADFVQRPAPRGATERGVSHRPSVAQRSAFARRLAGNWENLPVSTMASAAIRGSASAASPAPPAAWGSFYSMSAPEYLADPAAAFARSIAVGDVSGDGRDDLVFTSVRMAIKPEDERMEIYVAQQGVDGHMDPAIKVGETNHPLSYQLLLADLDLDGRKDIITVVVNGVALLRANENGTFTATTVGSAGPTTCW